MKPFIPPFLSSRILSQLNNKEGVFFPSFPPSLVPLVLDCLPFKFALICDEDILGVVSEDLSLYIEEKGVFYGKSVYKDGEGDFGGYEQEQRDLFYSSLSSGFKNKGFVLTSSEDLFVKKIQKQEVLEEILVDPSSSHDFLASSLRALNYVCVDFVSSPGEFAVRGCVIDFFPKESLFPVRVLFEKRASVFYVDPKTQLTTKEVSSFVLAKSKSVDFWVSLKSCLKDFCFVYIKKGGVSFFKKSPTKEAHLNIDLVSPSSCFEEKRKKSVYSSKTFGGFVYNDTFFIPEWLNKNNNKKGGFTGDAYIDFSSLDKGDFLIHEDFGVGEYLGLSGEGGEDFLVLKYRDAQIKVFPAFFNKVSFFKKQGDLCLLDSVGRSGAWKRRVSSVKKHLSLFVDSLFQSYLDRVETASPKYYIDPEIERDFLKKFPHTDTLDQKRVWSEIKKDLCSSAPMDRLLCGDVGFGKTEIAIRAAFLCSINGGRVLVVAPTTVLSKQLFLSFCERLEGFGIRVGFLSRFVSPKQQKDALSLFINKKIDVLVGTHSIINSEECLKGASLLVVDDEHKFGVKQKSDVRHLKTSINILYMSATPIPRTLSLALSDFSNISLISTPPPLKISPKTYIEPYDFKKIKRALFFEFSRQGQSFIIHNEIKTMPAFVSKIKKSLPFLSVDFMHAQEDPSVVEKKMDLFINKKIDVLVSSTILENGINIKNVNTVIINNAHRLGVSQLYQIRGRVGRGNSQSFAYLVYPKHHALSVAAKRRLKIIQKNSSLGSCYSVAMEDMRSRGSGTLFGYKQSGGVDSVGVELYSKFLNDICRKEKRGGCVVSHSLPAFIPKEYLPSSRLRVWGYKEVSLLKNEKDLRGFIEKATNMFGSPPPPFNNLLMVKLLSFLGEQCFFKKIEQKGGRSEIFLNEEFWSKKTSLLVDLFQGFDFIFSKGGSSIILKAPFDNNFVLILKKISDKL